MKICAHCHKELPIDQFSLCTAHGDGRQSYCKKCHAKVNKINIKAARAHEYSSPPSSRDSFFATVHQKCGYTWGEHNELECPPSM